MPPPAAGGGGEGGEGPETGSSQNMDYPELHLDGLPDESGLEGLPDEGHARIHYKVTKRGKESAKHGKEKGKNKHSATLEVHHITPEGGEPKKSEADTIRDKAQKYFQSQDQGGSPPGGADMGPTSEMPG